MVGFAELLWASLWAGVAVASRSAIAANTAKVRGCLMVMICPVQ
jgi:hypothetical protein